MYSRHLCNLKLGSQSNIPSAKSRFSRIRRTLRKLIIVSPNNRRCRDYFRSNAAIVLERKRQVESNLLYIIHPFSIFRLHWELWMTIVFILALVLNPLDATFKYSSDDWTKISAFIFLIDLQCFVDIVLDFFTGYGEEIAKEVILSPEKIVIKRFKNLFFYLETLACTPMIAGYYMQIQNVNLFLRLSGILKIIRFRKFLIYYQNTSDIWQLTALANTIILYSIVAILLIHWIGCLCYVIPLVFIENSVNYPIEDYWIGKSMLGEYSMEAQYVRCIFKGAMAFFNIQDLINVGTTKVEIAMYLIIVITGKVYMACMLVLITHLMTSNTSAELKYQEIINQVEEYMRYKQMPISMQKRLMAYYEYRFQKKYFRENLISSSLSVRLRREINVYYYRRLIESVSIFKDMPQHVLLDVVNSLKEEIYLPNDIIIKANTIGDCMYIIASGSVCVTTPSGKEICHLYDGAYFGEVELLMKEQKRIANVYALEICEMYRLDRKHFRNCFLNEHEVTKKLEKVANARAEKTAILEELHKKYLLTLESDIA
ncbi:hypothetical protein FQR65_LT03295 [Abscondita terminalis]|nr:hypothetical protein FQR65_LT03295 [Abscondita terminalis]